MKYVNPYETPMEHEYSVNRLSQLSTEDLKVLNERVFKTLEERKVSRREELCNKFIEAAKELYTEFPYVELLVGGESECGDYVEFNFFDQFFENRECNLKPQDFAF